MFVEGPEYLQRRNVPFSPPNVTFKELRAVIPPELYEKSILRGFFFLVQDVFTTWALYALSLRIDGVSENLTNKFGLSYSTSVAIAMAGCWCLAGHGNICKYGVINDTIGYFLHTCLLTPYFAWKSSHHTHYRTVGSIERDENYVPRTRSELGFTTVEQMHEMFEETPLYTVGHLLHFSPSSILFKKHEYNKIVASNVGLLLVSSILVQYSLKFGFTALLKHYIIPYLFCHHWIVMLTFLHHSDPTIPHYRAGQWTFLRGALATVDRPLLGFIGRMYFHNVSHDHIGHHIFSSIPFYNQPAVTEKIKGVLAEHYNYDSTNSFYALYRSFTQCVFIDDEGEVVMYRNGEGKTAREIGIIPQTGTARPLAGYLARMARKEMRSGGGEVCKGMK
ncbi:delta-12 fatty acid desaturase protein [Mycena pura]|uniref:Delta-12 fatty acid desaturase protein n=1 Tax=Mycena pura TaxID=153505 RepID=A0AAD6UUG3_9AGAR|nr:delta-12 fatty acid desaturase protein [Mycena pura]